MPISRRCAGLKKTQPNLCTINTATQSAIGEALGAAAFPNPEAGRRALRLTEAAP